MIEWDRLGLNFLGIAVFWCAAGMAGIFLHYGGVLDEITAKGFAFLAIGHAAAFLIVSFATLFGWWLFHDVILKKRQEKQAVWQALGGSRQNWNTKR